jgi:hypothetical protein
VKSFHFNRTDRAFIIQHASRQEGCDSKTGTPARFSTEIIVLYVAQPITITASTFTATNT